MSIDSLPALSHSQPAPASSSRHCSRSPSSRSPDSSAAVRRVQSSPLGCAAAVRVGEVLMHRRRGTHPFRTVHVKRKEPPMIPNETRFDAYRTALTPAPRRGRIARGMATAAVTAGLVVGGAGAAHASTTDTACTPGETTLMAVASGAALRDGWGRTGTVVTTAPAGSTVCATAFDSIYGEWTIGEPPAVAAASPVEFVALPSALPTSFSYSEKRAVLPAIGLAATPQLWPLPNASRMSGTPLAELEPGAILRVDPAFEVIGNDPYGGIQTATFVPARTADGTTGWVDAASVIDPELVSPEPTPTTTATPTPAETEATPEATASDTASQPSSSPVPDGQAGLEIPASWLMIGVADLGRALAAVRLCPHVIHAAL